MIWDFRSGDLLSFAGVVVAVLLAYMKRDNKIDLLSQRLGYLENTVTAETATQNRKIDSLSDLLMKMVRFEERMVNFDSRLTSQGQQIQEMKHGDGIILKRP